MSKPSPLDKPTRRGIDAFFREIDYRVPGYKPWRKAHDEVQAIEAELLNNPKYKAAKKRMEAAERAMYKVREAFQSKARAVRMKYRAEGLTPEVIKGVKELIRIIEKHAE